jgi:hypothetical protein
MGMAGGNDGDDEAGAGEVAAGALGCGCGCGEGDLAAAKFSRGEVGKSRSGRGDVTPDPPEWGVAPPATSAEAEEACAVAPLRIVVVVVVVVDDPDRAASVSRAPRCIRNDSSRIYIYINILMHGLRAFGRLFSKRKKGEAESSSWRAIREYVRETGVRGRSR